MDKNIKINFFELQKKINQYNLQKFNLKLKIIHKNKIIKKNRELQLIQFKKKT